MDLFWQQYFPASVIFRIGNITVYWYGVFMILAIIIAIWYAVKLAKNKPDLQRRKLDSLFFYLIIFGLIGARLYHVLFFNWSYYANHFWEIFKIWEGGLAIQGVILAGLITVYVWAKKNQISFWKISDWLVPALVLGQVIGRWGNYFNQELFGKPTMGWWRIPIASVHRVPGYEHITFFHPSFFYESFLNLIFFIILWSLTRKKIHPGMLTLLYLGGYSLIRFILEFIRIDPTPIVMGMRLPQLVSLVVVIIVIIILSTNPRPLSKSSK